MYQITTSARSNHRNPMVATVNAETRKGPLRATARKELSAITPYPVGVLTALLPP